MRGLVATVFSIALVLALVASPANARRRPAPSPTPSPTTTAVPTPAGTPVSQTAKLAKMRAQLEEIARTAPGRLGVAVVDLATDERFTIRGDESFGLASVDELPIAMVAYRLADQRRFALDERPAVARGYLGGVALTNWQSVRAMLVTHDASANETVSRAIGGPVAVQRIFARLHVRGLTIRTTRVERTPDALGTPSAVAELLVALATQRFTSLDSTYEIIDALEHATTVRTRLRAGIASPLRLADTTGTSETLAGRTNATNDVGLITLPDGRRIAVVAFLADSDADATSRDATLARVARAIADAYAP